jgi:hypothetical protein
LKIFSKKLAAATKRRFLRVESSLFEDLIRLSAVVCKQLVV